MRNQESRLRKLENPNPGPSTEALILADQRGGSPEQAEAHLHGRGRTLEELVLASMVAP